MNTIDIILFFSDKFDIKIKQIYPSESSKFEVQSSKFKV